MFALNQGEVCTCPSRALIQNSIYDAVPARGHRADQEDHPGQPAGHRHDDRRAGQQRPAGEDPVLHRDRHRRRAPGSSPAASGSTSAATCPAATTSRRRSSRATTRCGSSRRRSSARCVAVTRFDDYDDAIEIANDTLYGLGAGVWSRDTNTAYRAGRDIQAGRVWTNCYHAYPAHAAFGGYKQLGHRPGEPQDDARPLPADQEPAGVATRRTRSASSDDRMLRPAATSPASTRVDADPGGGGPAPPPPADSTAR